MAEQGGRCAICKRPFASIDAKKRATSVRVDHDHATGKVRGLLCNPCNTGLGMFQDSIGVLEEALAYLQKDKT